MTDQIKLGILGGTFDPIHLAHLLSAEVVRDTLRLSKVLFVPAGDPPHKQGLPLTPARHRRAMVELAIATNPDFELCPIDLERPGPHYSVDTVRLIRERYHVAPDDCFFIIGSDSLRDLPAWHEPQQLVKLCRLAVVHRPGYRPDTGALAGLIPGLTERLASVTMPQIELAASDIRARHRAGRSIRYQVLDSIWDYIQAQGLYR